jgi:anthranilate/para-aminobenzoate synthase component II
MLLMIDNYDSFTYNLVQYFGELGADVRTFRNDEITIEEIEALKPTTSASRPARAAAEAGISVPCCNTSRARCRCWACAWATRPSARRSAAR